MKVMNTIFFGEMWVIQKFKICDLFFSYIFVLMITVLEKRAQ